MKSIYSKNFGKIEIDQLIEIFHNVNIMRDNNQSININTFDYPQKVLLSIFYWKMKNKKSIFKESIENKTDIDNPLSEKKELFTISWNDFKPIEIWYVEEIGSSLKTHYDMLLKEKI